MGDVETKNLEMKRLSDIRLDRINEMIDLIKKQSKKANTNLALGFTYDCKCDFDNPISTESIPTPGYYFSGDAHVPWEMQVEVYKLVNTYKYYGFPFHFAEIKANSEDLMSGDPNVSNKEMTIDGVATLLVNLNLEELDNLYEMINSNNLVNDNKKK